MIRNTESGLAVVENNPPFVERAIIFGAGAGTGTFPSGSVNSKLLKDFTEFSTVEEPRQVPVMGFIAEDLALAGVKDLLVLTTPRGEQDVHDYFNDMNPELVEQLLRANPKNQEKIDKEMSRRASLGFTCVNTLLQQPAEYGTEIAARILAQYMKNWGWIDPDTGTGDPIIMASGDDWFYSPDRVSEHSLALEEWKEKGTDHLIFGMRVSLEEAWKYGLHKMDEDGNLIEIIEKPSKKLLASQQFQEEMSIDENGMLLANVSQYYLGPKIWKSVLDQETPPRPENGEYYFIDTLTSAVKQGQTIRVHEVQGHFMDCGKPESNAMNQKYLIDNPRTAPNQFAVAA